MLQNFIYSTTLRGALVEKHCCNGLGERRTKGCFNLLNPSGFCPYRQFNIKKFHVLPTQCMFVFCVDLRTNSNYFCIQHWLVFVTETEYVYCAVRTGSLYIILRSVHSVFMWFVWIWEQTAIISQYSINWLVFITETECFYCAVRTGSLYIYFYVLPTQYIYVFCVDLKTNSDYFSIQH